jgi:ATP-binding cassette subfamily F protein 2
MPSKSKEARMAKKADAKKKPTSKLASEANSGVPSKASSVNGDDDGTGPSMIDADELEVDEKVKKLKLQEDDHGLSDRVTTGVLASLEASRDVKITSASLTFHGRVLFNDTTIEVNYGRRYGLLGENGCGKSTLLRAIASREFPFPEHIDIYLLNEGAPPTNLGALEWVVKEAEKEVDRLEKLAEELGEKEGPESPIVMDIYDVSYPLLLWAQNTKY